MCLLSRNEPCCVLVCCWGTICHCDLTISAGHCLLSNSAVFNCQQKKNTQSDFHFSAELWGALCSWHSCSSVFLHGIHSPATVQPQVKWCVSSRLSMKQTWQPSLRWFRKSRGTTCIQFWWSVATFRHININKRHVSCTTSMVVQTALFLCSINGFMEARLHDWSLCFYLHPSRSIKR